MHLLNKPSRYCRDVRLSFCLSVCLSGMGMRCDLRVHCIEDLSLWLDSPVFWAPWHQSMSTYFQPSYSSSTWKRGAVWTMDVQTRRDISRMVEDRG